MPFAVFIRTKSKNVGISEHATPTDASHHVNPSNMTMCGVPSYHKPNTWWCRHHIASTKTHTGIRDGPNIRMTFGRSRRFGQAHQMSAKCSAECCVLAQNKIFYWWVHWMNSEMP